MKRLLLAHSINALLLCAFCGLATAAPQGADTPDRIELMNGSVIIGRFLDADAGKVTIKTDFAGTISIDQSRIASMDVKSALTLQLEDGTLLDTAQLVVTQQSLTLEDQQLSYDLEQLTRINPEPWELGVGYRHTGVASAAFSVQRGNTVRDDLAYRVDSRWRGLRDRYTLEAKGELRETNRERNSENWQITAKYDRFQTGDYYWGFAASIEEDRFADLDLRTRIGPYLGRSFFDNTPFLLEVETGVSQISETFGNAENRDYFGLTWSVRSESNYLGKDSRLYLDHKGVRNLADRQSTILNTTVGLAFPLLGQIEGAAEVVLNYNSGAVENVEELDQTYRFRLGYVW